MTIDRRDETVVTEGTTVPGAPDVVVADSSRATIRTEHQRVTTSWGTTEQIRRIIVLVFGLIQIFIALRIVLLLLDAREANGLVSAILDISQVFVAPFDGILRTDSLKAAGSVFDVTAIVALVGWTILELIIIWALGIFRREPA